MVGMGIIRLPLIAVINQTHIFLFPGVTTFPSFSTNQVSLHRKCNEKKYTVLQSRFVNSICVSNSLLSKLFLC
eukprot:UN27968